MSKEKEYRPRLSESEYQMIRDSRNENPSKNVLVIFDLHAPFILEGYLDFCKSIYEKYRCSSVVFIGDIIDNHYTSFHDTDPDGHSAAMELTLAKEQIKEFYDFFPVAKVCAGNHDILPIRKAFSAGLSSQWVRGIEEVLEVPKWEFAEEHIIDGVLYTHGTGRRARARCKSELISVVQGHWHSESYYETYVSADRMVFAMQGGCGIDRKSYAMAYGKHFNKPQINVGVVMDNGRWGLLEHMNLG